MTQTEVPAKAEFIAEPVDLNLVSIVVPFLNEEGSLTELHSEIVAAFDGIKADFELIFVDDGSTDDSPKLARAIAQSQPNVTLIRFRRNFGKAAALAAGFEAAKGQIIITMDADLQDDPKEIPRFIDEIQSGCDLVTGWKKRRHDPIDKTLPSRVFNWVTARAFDLRIHDINCGFKAYRKSVIPHLNLYGELHRFTPALAHGSGFSVKEIEIEHRAREHGVSKYGWSRIIKGLLDLLTVMLLTRYGTRPLHFFAQIGLPLLALGGFFITYLSVLWLFGNAIGHRPLLQIGILLVVTGVQFLGIGLIAELVRGSRMSNNDKFVVAEQTSMEKNP